MREIDTYSIDLESPFKLDSYEGVKQTFLWISDALKAFNKKPLKTTESFLFYLGKITCSLESFSSFKKQAFGAEGFKHISFQVIAFYPMENIVHFNCTNTICITASKKEWLEVIVSLLKSAEDKKSQPISITYNDAIIVNGDKNIVANDGSTISISGDYEREKKPSRLKVWVTAIGQNIAANGIWYLLCITGSALITWLAIK